MSIQIDSVDITGMKHSDFEQLQEIFSHFMEQGVYWGRQDYFDKRNARIADWLHNVVMQTRDVKIKG